MKRFFVQRTLREQGMLLLFGVAALAWWGTAVTGRWEHLYAAWRQDNETQATQALWLRNRATITARVAAAGRSLDPAKTLDAAQTFAELNGMLQGLKAELGGQRTEQTGDFAIHSVQVSIRQASLAELVRFYQRLSARAPYIGIEQCTFEADRASPGQLNARLRVYAIGMIRPGQKTAAAFPGSP